MSLCSCAGALFGHTYLFVDHQVPEPHVSPLFTDGRTVELETVLPYPSVRYLALLDTFSAHRMLPDDRRAALHGGIGEVIDAGGGVLDVRLLTGLALARRAG